MPCAPLSQTNSPRLSAHWITSLCVHCWWVRVKTSQGLCNWDAVAVGWKCERDVQRATPGHSALLWCSARSDTGSKAETTTAFKEQTLKMLPMQERTILQLSCSCYLRLHLTWSSPRARMCKQPCNSGLCQGLGEAGPHCQHELRASSPCALIWNPGLGIRGTKCVAFLDPPLIDCCLCACP